MAIVSITREEFDSLNPARSEMVSIISRETSWYADTARNIIGAVLFDRSDKDWNYVILAKHEDGAYRWVAGDTCIKAEDDAEIQLANSMGRIESSGRSTESLFNADENLLDTDDCRLQFIDINAELKRYFQKHPERLHDLSPRKFEELIASIMEDMGFDVELTQATRDGGKDIIAYIRNAVCSYLTYIECKKYASDQKVGVGVVREVAGVHNIRRATKSVIVTTSFFSKDAMQEAAEIEHQLELRDYDDIKQWLAMYS